MKALRIADTVRWWQHLEMARKRQERRKAAEERWPLLSNLCARHFNQEDLPLDGAIRAAVAEGSLDHRQAVLGEWHDWQRLEGLVDDIRPSLNDSLSLDMSFKTAAEARYLMNRIYDGLVEGIRAEKR